MRSSTRIHTKEREDNMKADNMRMMIRFLAREVETVGPIERREMERCEEIERRVAVANMKGNK